MHRMTVVAIIGISALDLLFIDADIKAELEHARVSSSQDAKEAECAVKRAQELIKVLWVSSHPAALDLALRRQEELDAIKMGPWAHRVLFNGHTLCLANCPDNHQKHWQTENADTRQSIPAASRLIISPRKCQPRQYLSPTNAGNYAKHW